MRPGKTGLRPLGVAAALILSLAAGGARAQAVSFQATIRSLQAVNPRDPGYDGLSRACGQAIGLYYARLQLERLWTSRADVAQAWATFLYYHDTYVRGGGSDPAERLRRAQAVMARNSLTLVCNAQTQVVSVIGGDSEGLQTAYLFPLPLPAR